MFDMANSAFINRLIDELTRDGEMAIHDAYYNRDWNNRTYNLHDSYGSAVYYNGRLIKKTIRYVGPEQAKSGLNKEWVWTKGRSMQDFRGERRLPGDEVQMRGRDEVMDFFSQYTPQGRGLELVIVAAMFYASYLEDGAGRLKKKYKVISSGATTMQELAAKYNGLLRNIRLGRVHKVMTTIKDKSWA